MFFHIGGYVTIPLKQIVAIIDGNTNELTKKNKLFLEKNKKREKFVVIAENDIKSYVVTTDKVYGSPISSLTLKRRAQLI
ncbi:DUF370 domain-containing protein [Microaerobacter geothermalis]|uniref:extracellular matrix regulator RemB n=1 Tax=Microaerobacter geothermalis TaxID=674972 RepID=UPI001F383117|nr:extracellular matrix/biofilm biosynthesis regulator RemA family protein [Microaerobacter geothermalis]MCF6095090.1 DUF370 domain-containing protein [Microaerobacter geothermalis]